MGELGPYHRNRLILILGVALQVMDRLRLNEGDPIRIWGARMPKGKMIKIQPQSVDFLELSDPKAVYVLSSFFTSNER